MVCTLILIHRSQVRLVFYSVTKVVGERNWGLIWEFTQQMTCELRRKRHQRLISCLNKRYKLDSAGSFSASSNSKVAWGGFNTATLSKKQMTNQIVTLLFCLGSTSIANANLAQHNDFNISRKCVPLSVTEEVPLESLHLRRVLIELIVLMLPLMLEKRSFRSNVLYIFVMHIGFRMQNVETPKNLIMNIRLYFVMVGKSAIRSKVLVPVNIQ